MAKESTLQVRMDGIVKERVEELYRGLGTSFAEAVRVFAVQSINAQGYPFAIHASREQTGGARGILRAAADPAKRAKESHAFEAAMEAKHAGAR